jgi:hypothetical protein
VNRSTRTLLAAAALLSGCATFSEQECRTADWYRLGEQDALTHGLRPQIDHLAHQCQKFGVQVPENQYMAGWDAGNRERAVRLSGSPRP